MKRAFISYPKSGRSWIRYALVQMGAGQGIRFHHDGFEFNDGAKPPLNFDIDRRLAGYQDVDRIIYLERDPRDVMCSLYHQITGRFQDFFDYRGTMSEFLRDPYFGAANLHRFRQMWAQIATRRSVLRISYEAMTQDGAATLRALAVYLDLPVADGALDRAVAQSAFPRMQAVEQEGNFAQPWLRMRNGYPKVRQGRVHGFRADLSPDDIAYLNALFGMDD